MKIRKVVGNSMLPALKSGDTVLVKKRKHKVGDIVVARLNGREVIKRITKLNHRQVWLEGDNAAASTDSRHHGSISEDSVSGVVNWHFRFAESYKAPSPHNKKLLTVPLKLAVITIISLVIICFKFDVFVTWLENFQMNGELGAKVLAAFIILIMLFALPFWLRLRLSPLARLCSIACGVILTVLWPFVTLFLFTLLAEAQAYPVELLLLSFSLQLMINVLLGFLTIWSFYILSGVHLVRRLKPARV